MLPPGRIGNASVAWLPPTPQPAEQTRALCCGSDQPLDLRLPELLLGPGEVRLQHVALPLRLLRARISYLQLLTQRGNKHL
jgi:hypothetical protein